MPDLDVNIDPISGTAEAVGEVIVRLAEIELRMVEYMNDAERREFFKVYLARHERLDKVGDWFAKLFHQGDEA